MIVGTMRKLRKRKKQLRNQEKNISISDGRKNKINAVLGVYGLMVKEVDSTWCHINS